MMGHAPVSYSEFHDLLNAPLWHFQEPWWVYWVGVANVIGGIGVSVAVAFLLMRSAFRQFDVEAGRPWRLPSRREPL
jgi:hypothetical protein